MPTDQQIKERIEAAFEPLRCVAEIWDYGKAIRFMVFDRENNGIFEVKRITLEHINDSNTLEMILADAKELVTKITNK